MIIGQWGRAVSGEHFRVFPDPQQTVTMLSQIALPGKYFGPVAMVTEHAGR